MKCLLSASGQQGFVVINDGDIVSVFISNERLVVASFRVLILIMQLVILNLELMLLEKVNATINTGNSKKK